MMTLFLGLISDQQWQPRLESSGILQSVGLTVWARPRVHAQGHQGLCVLQHARVLVEVGVLVGSRGLQKEGKDALSVDLGDSCRSRDEP